MRTRRELKSIPVTVHIRIDQFQMVEEVRKKLGFSRSGFLRYCILRTLEDLDILSNKVKEDLKVSI